MKQRKDSPLDLVGVEDVLFILKYIKDRVDSSKTSIREINKKRNSAFKERGKEKKIKSPDTTLNNICTRRIGLTINQFDELVFKWLTEHSEELKSQILSHLNKKNAELLEEKIKDFFRKSNIVSEFSTFRAEEFYKNIEAKVKESRQLSPDERKKRLEKAPKKPERIQLIQLGFRRNQDVIAEVLERANGFCESCKNFAPFLRDSDGTPFLEVHHKIPLAEGGDDTVDNAIALCPNCHRKAHFGKNSL